MMGEAHRTLSLNGSQTPTQLLPIFLRIARNPAGLKAHDSPLTVPIAINPCIPESSADIAIAILPHHIGLRCDDGSVPVNPYLDIA
jgi:hypothetical protein